MLNIDDRLIKEISPIIGPDALSVLLAISIHLGKGHDLFPSHKTLMRLTKMGKNAVYNALKVLKDNGLLETIQKIDSKNNRFGRRYFKVTTTYIKIFVNAPDAEPLESVEPDEEPFPDSREPETRFPDSGSRKPGAGNRETYNVNDKGSINKDKEPLPLKTPNNLFQADIPLDASEVEHKKLEVSAASSNGATVFRDDDDFMGSAWVKQLWKSPADHRPIGIFGHLGTGASESPRQGDADDILNNSIMQGSDASNLPQDQRSTLPDNQGHQSGGENGASPANPEPQTPPAAASKPAKKKRSEREAENREQRIAEMKAIMKPDVLAFYNTIPDLWEEWIDHKRAKKQLYLDAPTECKVVKVLMNYAQGDAGLAERIINNSFANPNWQGFFPLKPWEIENWQKEHPAKAPEVLPSPAWMEARGRAEIDAKENMTNWYPGYIPISATMHMVERERLPIAELNGDYQQYLAELRTFWSLQACGTLNPADFQAWAAQEPGSEFWINPAIYAWPNDPVFIAYKLVEARIRFHWQWQANNNSQYDGRPYRSRYRDFTSYFKARVMEENGTGRDPFLA
jgi:DNA-binding transcriptional ArsR family regulator